MAIRIFLNGESYQSPDNSLMLLIEDLQLTGKRFAVEINAELIPKSLFSVTQINNDDKVEIIEAVGGG